jgi:hypothetical protein
MAPAALTTTLAVAALLATSSSVDALRAAPVLDDAYVHPPAFDTGPPGAPPTPPHNGSVMVRHRRELGAMDGWSDGRCTWYGGAGGPGPDGMNIFKGSCGCVRRRCVACAMPGLRASC